MVRAYRDEEVIIQAKPGVSQYNPDPNDRTFRRSSHFFPNPAISIQGAYVDVSGFKTFGQVVIAAHDVALERCDLGGGGPHMNQGQVVVLNSNRPGGVYNVVIRNNRIHHSTWGESVGNGSTLMCYNASFVAEHNEFHEGYGADICLKDTGMQEGRFTEIRYNLFLNKGTGVSFRTPARLGTMVHNNTFINCGGGGQNGDVSDRQNPEIQLWNNLYYHTRPITRFLKPSPMATARLRRSFDSSTKRRCS